jgi:hypothetical protein
MTGRVRVQPDRELIKKTNYLMSALQIRRLIDEEQISCPKCGGRKLIWECCSINVVDSELIEKLREDVKR